MRNRLCFAFWGLLLSGFVYSCGGTEEPAQDAGSDSAPDSTVACNSDSACNDGDLCNGQETCGENGFCVPGEPLSCDDGIECTLNRCSPTLGCQFPAPDLDGDGYQDANCLDGSGLPLGTDCDDTDINRFPDNIEFCDAENRDEDCNPNTFGALDRDGDGSFDAQCCNSNGDTLICGNDCDDLRGNVNVSATEVCDGVDNNCNDMVDEGVALSGFVDGDRDGHGDPAQPIQQCAGSVGFSSLGDDCNDASASQHPGQLELCDSVDNDCDTEVDEAENSVPWYPDTDGDGFGSAEGPVVVSCTPVSGHSLLDSDCNDQNAGVNPAAAEACDGVDNDCNGEADFRLGPNDFEDDDGDGLVDIRCGPLGIDCDDRDPATGPGTPERCDGRDNDCDQRIDEDSDGRIWFRDLDGDAFGSADSGTTVSCSAIPGFQQQSGDCADTDPTRFPGASEQCNGIDDNCNFQIDDGASAPDGCNPANGIGACGAGGCAIASCAPGFDDCDNNPANGCEVSLTTNNNCGSCFSNCSFPNATASCATGECVMGGCSTGFDDCDPLVPGCETLLNTTSNCGSCGDSCSIPGGLAVCAEGQCLAVRCPEGFEDCDGNRADCEADLSSTANCGDCGRQCNGNNGTATCTDGDCRITCTGTFEDCNRNSFDGCEADTQSDINNCGGCNFFCGAPDTNFACNLGSCEITSCMAGRIDCDTDPQNGCEVDPQTDPSNCGGCSSGPGSPQECSFPNADSSCVGGSCQMGSCFGDFRDCNMDSMDGCEADTQFDPMNCGGCSTGPGSMEECDLDNANPRCEFGVCRIGNCFGGFTDCNFDPSDGCEADTQNDPMNCGGCGVQCGVGGGCNDGRCDGVVEVAMGHDFTCAVRESGLLVCWGANDNGQLGNGGGGPSFMPVVVERLPSGQLTGVRGVVAGLDHACALTDAGTFCWGDNSDGQLGDGGFTSANRATQVMLDPGFIQLAAGSKHTCGLTAMGEVFCFGNDAAGQVGNGSATGPVTIPSPIELLGGSPVIATQIVAGDAFSCALQFNGTPTCWGSNSDGQLGTGDTVPSDTPTVFAAAGGASQIIAGANHACYVRRVASDFIECWGRGDEGQNGDAGLSDRLTPAPLDSVIFDPLTLVAGAAHTCALDGSRSVSCWGQNLQAQLGTGATSGPQSFPTVISFGQVDSLARPGPIADHSCVLQNDGAVFCWGQNLGGQVGVDALTSPVPFPTAVTGLP